MIEGYIRRTICGLSTYIVQLNICSGKLTAPRDAKLFARRQDSLIHRIGCNPERERYFLGRLVVNHKVQDLALPVRQLRQLLACPFNF